MSGRERNCCYLNTHSGQFADISSATGFDFPSDTRGLAAVDWDHDGDLDVWLSNRTSPRLRFLRNEYFERLDNQSNLDGHWVALRLRGISCNRDAIGARVTVHTNDPSLKATRTLRAGEGYLSQTSKWLHFGLGKATAIESVEITWPAGGTERIQGLALDQRFEIVQGAGKATAWGRPGRVESIARNTRNEVAEPLVRPIRIVAHRRMPIPSLQFHDESAGVEEIRPAKNDLQLVVVWATWCTPCLSELQTLTSHQKELQEANLSIVTLCIDEETDGAGAPSKSPFETLREIGVDWPGGLATDTTKTKLDILRRILVSREKPFAIPMSMLLDREGRLAVIYEGAVPLPMLLQDTEQFSQPSSDTRESAIPFSGSWYVNPLPPDLMSVVEKLMAAQLPHDALEYMDRHLRPTVSGKQPSSVWTKAQVADGYFRIGLALARSETRQGAERAFATTIQLAPDLLVARAAMASLLEAEGRVADALKEYEQLRQRQPNNPLVLNNIAWILASSDDPQILGSRESNLFWRRKRVN